MKIDDEEVEAAAAAMYGKNWNGPEDRRPGDKMKDVWRKYAREALVGAAEFRRARAIDWNKVLRT